VHLPQIPSFSIVCLAVVGSLGFAPDPSGAHAARCKHVRHFFGLCECAGCAVRLNSVGFSVFV
jgi:hypothetical protein